MAEHRLNSYFVRVFTCEWILEMEAAAMQRVSKKATQALGQESVKSRDGLLGGH